MAVAFDVATESHTGTTGNTSSASFTWNHTGGASAKGALVFVFSIGALTDTSVTYDGTTMLAVPYTAADTDTELGSVRAYYLDNCGTGTKAVIVNRTNNAVQMYAVCYTVTAAGPTEVYQQGVKTKSASTAIATAASSTGTGTGTLAEATVDDGSPGTNSLRFMGRYQGTSNVTAAGPNSTAPASAAASIDFGLFVIDTFYETTAGQGARNVGGATITDDVAAILLAVREIPLAGVGSATGTSRQPLASVATMGGVAAATGSALQPTVQTLIVTSAPAEVASATGTARQPLAAVGAQSGVASGVGTAQQPSARAEALAAAGLGSATGTAQAPLASHSVQTGLASATGSAQQPSARPEAFAAAGAGSVTGTAQAPTANPAGAAGVVTATGAALSGAAAIGTAAEVATVSVTAGAPTANPGAVESATTASGTAHDATVETIPVRSGDAEAATALAAAYDPTGAVAVMVGLASAIGTAWDATVTVVQGGNTDASAEHASVTGTAWDPTVTTLMGDAAGQPRGSIWRRHPGVPKVPEVVREVPLAYVPSGMASAIATAHDPTVLVDWVTDEWMLGLSDEQLPGEP